MANIFWVLLFVTVILSCWSSAWPVSSREAEVEDLQSLLTKSFDSDYEDAGGAEDMDTAGTIVFRPLFRYRVKRSDPDQR